MRTLFTLIAIWFCGQALGFEDVDFDHSSGLDLMEQYSAKYADPNADIKIQILKDNYERLKPSKTPSNSTPIIPKVIHQVWLGTASMPQNYKYYLATWKNYHPGWEFKLWTEKEIIQENFPTMDLFYLARSYQERSDLIRYEILKKYGGLYIDTDIECFAKFDELHYKYDFYSNYEPPAINKKRVSILNAMIASVPNHPIISDTLTKIRKNWYKVEEEFEEKYSISKSSFSRSNHHLAVERTMYPFGDAVFDFLGNKQALKYKTIILPSGYNVPVYFVNDIPIINLLSRIFRDKAKLSNQIMLRPETMSVHFHDKESSLMQEDYFANSLFNHSEIKGVTYMLFHLRDKYYLAFRKLFQSKFPNLVSYQINPLIPLNIYLDNSTAKLSEEDLSKLKTSWVKLNSNFNIITLNEKDLLKFLPKEFYSVDKDVQILIAQFCLLFNEGGVYVTPNFKPADLEEFNYKYGYYGKFNKIKHISDKLSLDTNMSAFTDSHSILRNLLSELKEEVNKNKKITIDTVKKMYIESAYRYYELDGASLILPEVYFNQKR